MKSKWSVFLFLIMCIGCSTSKVSEKEDMKALIEKERVVKVGEVLQYYNSILPHWANFSVAGQCFREQDIYYLNYPKVEESFGLSYGKLVELQVLLNQEIFKIEDSGKKLSINERSNAFYESIDKITGGVEVFTIPNFQRYHLIWIDGMSETTLISWLKDYGASELMEYGVPVLLSFCFGKKKLEAWLEKHELYDLFSSYITSEYFSIYNEQLVMTPSFHLVFKELFPKKAKLYLLQNKIFKEREPSWNSYRYFLEKIYF